MPSRSGRHGRSRSDPNRCRCRSSSSLATPLRSATILVQCTSIKGTDHRAEPQQLITRAWQQFDGRAAGPMTAQPGGRERLPGSPAKLVQEREHGLGGPVRLQPGERLPGDGDLDLVQHLLIAAGQPQPGQMPRRRPGRLRRGAEARDRGDDGGPGQGDLPQHPRARGTGNRVRDHLRPVQAGQPQPAWRPAASARVRPRSR